MSARRHGTCEQLFEAEVALRTAARRYTLSDTSDHRKMLRAAARAYAAVAVGIDALAIAPSGEAKP